MKNMVQHREIIYIFDYSLIKYDKNIKYVYHPIHDFLKKYEDCANTHIFIFAATPYPLCLNHESVSIIIKMLKNYCKVDISVCNMMDSFIGKFIDELQSLKVGSLRGEIILPSHKLSETLSKEINKKIK